ncbi:MAG: DM13 domain-containing protein [Pseudomonadota bacterium]
MKRILISSTLAAALISLGGAGVALADDHVRTGTFTGASNHITTGTVELVKTDEGYEIHLKDNFTFDGAPDPRIGFGKDGIFVDPTDFEVLQSNAGAQVYKVPSSINPEEFDDIFVWCRKFSVPLGVASLSE